MKTKSSWLIAILWALLPLGAVADGMFFPPVALAPVEIPDQRALIHFQAGQETLVIDTGFRATGGDVAWVVPVPSKPEITPVSPGVFTTLEILLAPKVMAHWPNARISIVGLGLAVIASIVALRRGTRLLTVLACWLLGLLLLSLGLPAMSHAKGSNGTIVEDVRVLERKTVGVFDTVTLASPRGEAVREWLNRNGFETPSSVGPVLADYAAKGWVFVASRLHPTAGTNAPTRAHPLCLRFATPRAVYPMRLTGVRNPPLKVELYVFGSSRATAKGLEAEVCAKTAATSSPSREATVLQRVVPVVHPGLLQLVGSAEVATKLCGTLSPAQMAEDVWIDWEAFQPKWKTLYTDEAATVAARNLGLSLLMLGWVICVAIACLRRPTPTRFLFGSLLAVAVVAAVVGWREQSSLPRAKDVRIHKGSSWKYDWRLLASEVEIIASDIAKESAGRTPDVITVRTALADYATNTNIFKQWINPYTDKAPREEDSPGNYTVSSNATGVAILWYDQAGAVQSFPVTGSGKKAKP